MEGGRAGDGSQAARSQSWSSGLEQVLPAEAKDRPHLEDRGRGPPALQLSVTPTPPWGPRLHVGCEAAVKRRSGPSTPTGPLPGGQKYALKLEFYANTYRTDFLLPCVIIVQLPGLPGGGGLGSGVCCRWHALDGHSLGTPSHSFREQRRLFLGPPRPPVLLERKSPSRSQERIPRPPAGSRACSGDAPRDHPPPGAGTKRTPGVTAPWGAAPHQPRSAGAETGGETGRPAQGFTPGSRPSWDSNPGPSCLSPPFPPPTPA